MADYYAVLKRTLSGFSDPQPQLRSKLYDRARTTIERQLKGRVPPLDDAMLAAELVKLDGAIQQIEADYTSVDDGSVDAPAAGVPAVSPPESTTESGSISEPASQPAAEPTAYTVDGAAEAIVPAVPDAPSPPPADAVFEPVTEPEPAPVDQQDTSIPVLQAAERLASQNAVPDAGPDAALDTLPNAGTVDDGGLAQSHPNPVETRLPEPLQTPAPVAEPPVTEPGVTEPALTDPVVDALVDAAPDLSPRQVPEPVAAPISAPPPPSAPQPSITPDVASGVAGDPTADLPPVAASVVDEVATSDPLFERWSQLQTGAPAADPASVLTPNSPSADAPLPALETTAFDPVAAPSPPAMDDQDALAEGMAAVMDANPNPGPVAPAEGPTQAQQDAALEAFLDGTEIHTAAATAGSELPPAPNPASPSVQSYTDPILEFEQALGQPVSASASASAPTALTTPPPPLPPTPAPVPAQPPAPETLSAPGLAAQDLPAFHDHDADLTIPPAPGHAASDGASKRSFVPIVLGLLGVLVLGGLGYAGYINRDAVLSAVGLGSGGDFATPKPVKTITITPEPEAADAPDDSSAAPKIDDRLPADGDSASTTPNPTPAPPTPAPSTAPTSSGTDGTQTAINTTPDNGAATTTPPASPAVAQKAILYEETNTAGSTTSDSGRVVWSVVQEAPASGEPPEPAIRARVEVPNRGVVLIMTLKRNADRALPASHLIDLVFAVPDDFAGGNIQNINRVVLKEAEQSRGDQLVAVPARIADGIFLIALNNLDEAKSANEILLKTRGWIDIPVVYRTGRRALLTIEKGIPGEGVFEQVFKAWEGK